MARSRQWTREACIAAVRSYERDALQAGREPSLRRYWEWSQGCKERPSSTTLLTEFGTWNNARSSSHAGEAVALNPQHAKRRWSEQDTLGALRRYEADCQAANRRATRDGYQEWQKRYPDVPSVDAIEKRGSWNVMRLRAAEKPGDVTLFAPRRPRTQPKIP